MVNFVEELNKNCKHILANKFKHQWGVKKGIEIVFFFVIQSEHIFIGFSRGQISMNSTNLNTHNLYQDLSYIEVT